MAASKLAGAGLPNLNSAMVVRRSWRGSNHDLAQRFVDAEVEDLNLVRANPTLAAKSLAGVLKLDSDIALQSSLWAVANVYSIVPFVRPEAFIDSIDLFSQQNKKLSGFDPNTIIYNSFVQSAQDRGLTQP